MARHSDKQRTQAELTPEGTFVIQLRTGSDVSRRRLSGRVEHVMSGRSAQFASLSSLLAFMARFAGTGVTPSPAAKAKNKPGAPQEE